MSSATIHTIGGGGGWIVPHPSRTPMNRANSRVLVFRSPFVFHIVVSSFLARLFSHMCNEPGRALVQATQRRHHAAIDQNQGPGQSLEDRVAVPLHLSRPVPPGFAPLPPSDQRPEGRR